MSAALLTAAGLTLFVAAAHSYLGERYILIRLFRRDNLPKILGNAEFTKRTLRFAWHITSVAWLGLAGLILTLAAPHPATGIQAGLISGVFLLSGAIALVASRGRHLSWIVFFSIAGLTLFGTS